MKLKLLTYILYFGLLLLTGSFAYFITEYFKLKKENNRLESNFQNAYAKIDSVEGKNKELHYTLKGLVLEKDELKETQTELVDQLQTMRIKLKNVKSIVQTKYEYITKIDTVWSQRKTDTLYVTKISDNYIQANWNSQFRNDKLLVTNFNLNLQDTLSIISETVYKGWWIFRKPKGVKINIKSENPYWKVDDIKYIELKK